MPVISCQMSMFLISEIVTGIALPVWMPCIMIARRSQPVMSSATVRNMTTLVRFDVPSHANRCSRMGGVTQEPE